MAFVVSAGEISGLHSAPGASIADSVQYRMTYYATYEQIFETQPAVRTVIGYMARNIAQLGIHVFERASDIDRVRVTDHPLAVLIRQPMPAKYKVTTYRLMSDLMHDLGIYDVALWLKLRPEDSGPPGALLRIPPGMFKPGGDNWFAPEYFVIKGSKGKREVAAEDVVYLRGYNPKDARTGLSPMETLRQTLAEEWEARIFREQMWQNGARMPGYISRPVNAPRWRDGARERFLSQFEDSHTGQGDKAGGPALLEDGMQFVNAGVTPEQAQYIEGRRFTREEVAAAYFIPPSMVGIMDNATFSNITEQHKMVYQDALGPWLQSLQQDIQLQLLPDLEPNPERFYVEFNIGEKLKGSFEEQASSISTLVGRPVLTANEGRALLNRNELPEGDGLVLPLNVLIGGQAAPNQPTEDPGSPPEAADLGATGSASRTRISAKARVPEGATEDLSASLAKFFERQGRSVVSKAGAKAKAGEKASAESIFNLDRWNRDLTGLLFPMVSKIVALAGVKTATELGTGYDEDQTTNWIFAHVSGVASGINGQTLYLLQEALKSDDPKEAVAHLFEVAATSRAKLNAESEATAASSFGTHEAVRQSGKGAKKTWATTSKRPRRSHAKMNGETVGMDELFSNGARWPGDSKLKPEERARCSCDLRIELEE